MSESTPFAGEFDLRPTNPTRPSLPLADPQPLPQTVTYVGSLTLLRSHAVGGLGEVLVARDDALHRDVAFKRLRPEQAASPDARRRFLLEAEITSRLEHPGVVPIYSLVLGADAHAPACYAMRFIEGDTLRAAIAQFHQDGPGAPGFAGSSFRGLLQRFIAVCQTAAFAHSRGIIHRDIKPSNVMLGKFGETLLVDWGLAKPLDRPEVERPADDEPLFLPPSAANAETQIGHAVGTPAYMSPEQATGRWHVVGPASDIYSLGATLYEMLTGRVPYQGHDAFDLIMHVQCGEFPRPTQCRADVPSALEAICLKAMAYEPAQRYATAQELADDVEHWLADEPVTAFAEPWRARAGRWMRQHRAVVSSGVAALVVIALSLAVGAGLLEAANGELRAANARAETNADRAYQAQRQAEVGFNKAREAVDKYLQKVAEDPQLKNTPGLHAVREQLLQAAVPFFTWFTEQRPTEPQLRADQGWAFGRLAAVQEELGATEAASAQRRRHRDVCAALVAEHPQVAAFHSDYGGALHNLASALTRDGRNEEALPLYEQALVEQEKAVLAEPANAKYRKFLANHNNNLGILLLAQGRPAAAEQAYRRALEIDEKLAADFPTEPEYLQDVAMGHNNLGDLFKVVGQRSEAERAFRQALAIQEKLAADFAATPMYRQDLIKTCLNLGIVLAEMGPAQLAEAEQAVRQALETAEKLAADFPAVPAYRYDRAGCQVNLANLLRDQRQWPAAEEAYRRALELHEKLVADFPSVPIYRQELARTYNNLGILLTDFTPPRRAEAEQAYRRASDLYEKLRADFPTALAYRLELAGAYVNQGRLHLFQGQAQASLDLFAKAITLLEPILQQEPRLAMARLYLRNAHFARAQALQRLDRHVDALKDWDRTLDLNAERATEPGMRAGRARSLAHTGEPARAVAEASALAEAAEVTGFQLYDLAGVCALASAAVIGDPKLSDQYAVRAVELLRQAAAKGFKDIEHLKNSDDFKALREREDFKQLLPELSR